MYTGRNAENDTYLLERCEKMLQLIDLFIKNEEISALNNDELYEINLSMKKGDYNKMGFWIKKKYEQRRNKVVQKKITDFLSSKYCKYGDLVKTFHSINEVNDLLGDVNLSMSDDLRTAAKKMFLIKEGIEEFTNKLNTNLTIYRNKK